MLRWITLLFCAIMFLSYKSYESSQSLDTMMTESEQKSTGVEKLTPKERQALQEWINRNHYPKNRSRSQKHPTLSEVLGSGRYVKLSDHSLWLIDPSDLPVTQGWISPVEIVVTFTRSGAYPYRLTNSVTGSTVKAQKTDHLPPSLQSTPLTPSTPKKEK